MIKAFLRRLVALTAAYALVFHAAWPALLGSVVPPPAADAAQLTAFAVICSASHPRTVEAPIGGSVQAGDPAPGQAPAGIPPCWGDPACAMAGCAAAATWRDPPSLEHPVGVAARLAPRPRGAARRTQALAGINLARAPPAA